MPDLLVHAGFDGCSKGTPGVGGSGWWSSGWTDEYAQIGWSFNPYCTCNVSEYMALIGLLSSINVQNHLEHSTFDKKELYIQGDSELVIKQVMGEYRVSTSHLKKFHKEVCLLLKQLSQYGWKIKFKKVPRQDNKVADFLSNVPTRRGKHDPLRTSSLKVRDSELTLAHLKATLLSPLL